MLCFPLADGLSQLQAALSSTQQFPQMFEELRSWLDKQADPRDSSTDSLPCKPEAIRSLLAKTDELQRGIASQRGSYELIQAEGASLLATLPAGGDERSALQSRLASLRQDWEGQNQKISDRESRLKATLSKAETYQQHKTELVPWLAECEKKDGEKKDEEKKDGVKKTKMPELTQTSLADRFSQLQDAENAWRKKVSECFLNCWINTSCGAGLSRYFIGLLGLITGQRNILKIKAIFCWSALLFE